VVLVDVGVPRAGAAAGAAGAAGAAEAGPAAVPAAGGDEDGVDPDVEMDM
jgi:hypothetical protein